MPLDDEAADALSDPGAVSDALPSGSGDEAINEFCTSCPNWVAFQFSSNIPRNMPRTMAFAQLSEADIPIDEAGLGIVVTDPNQDFFEFRGQISSSGYAFVNLPTGLEEVQFAFESERPTAELGVPEEEQPSDDDNGEYWIVGIAKGALRGVENAINEVGQAVDEFAFWTGWNPGYVYHNGEWQWMTTEERQDFFDTYGYVNWVDFGIDPPQGVAGQVTEGVAQFLVGFIPAVRAVRMVRATSAIGATGQAMAAGAIADAIVFDPHERRLSELVNEFPELRNPVTEYLAADPNDSSAEGRLKNALEGIVFGAVLDRFVAALRVMKTGLTRMVINVRAQYTYRFRTESLQSVSWVLRRAAQRVEPPVTNFLRSTAQQLGGTMQGLEYRIKTQASLERKISGDAVDENLAYSEVAEQIFDVLRYTMEFPDSQYAASVNEAIARLEQEGYRRVRLKSFWSETGYQGINCVFSTPSGYRFELQFHTPASLVAKEEGHGFYELIRTMSASPERDALEAQMNTIYSQVPIPSGVNQVE